MTDCFFLQGQNKMFTERWRDLVDLNRVVDERSADEIAADVIKNAGLTFGGE